MITGIPSVQIPNEWERIRPFLENFAMRSHCRWTVDNLLMDLQNRQRQVWKVNDYQALFLTSIYPDSVHIDALSGKNRKDWQDDVLEAMEHWARALGKRHVISMARPGWHKFFKGKGYREIHREYLKEVQHG